VAFSPAKAQSYGELEGRVGRVSREGRLLRERRRLTADRKGFEGFGSWSIAPCSSRRSWQQTKEGREGSSAPDWLTNSLKDEQEQSKAKQSDQPRDPLRDDCTAPHSTTEVKGANTICSQGGGGHLTSHLLPLVAFEKILLREHSSANRCEVGSEYSPLSYWSSIRSIW
jgi:hypothetical protein